MTSRCRSTPTAATDSTDALQAVLDRGGTLSLLVCDYHLADGETGADAIRKLRSNLDGSVPVILVTGDTSSSIGRALDEIEDCHLMSKPVDAAVLFDLAERLLRERVPSAAG